MKLKRKSGGEPETIQRLLVTMPGARSSLDLVEQITSTLAGLPSVALARLWLLGRGDRCSNCPHRPDCPGWTDCLHRVAEGARPESTGGAADVPREALGHHKIGHIGAGAGPIHIERDFVGSPWVQRPEWVRREGIVGFGGRPIVGDGQILGVLAVYTREPLTPEGFATLGRIADQAGACLAALRRREDLAHRLGMLRLECDSAWSEAAADLAGPSAAMEKVRAQIRAAAATAEPVLIRGEVGTGKHGIAHRIHQDRGNTAPWLHLDAVRQSGKTIEAILSGAETTGTGTIAFESLPTAPRGTAALFPAGPAAFLLFQGGTLYMEEPGALGPAAAAQLLVFLERAEDARDRGAPSLKVIASTTRALHRDVEDGTFPAALYHRLAVATVETAPLRERRDDLKTLAAVHGERLARRLGVPAPTWNRRHLTQLTDYAWPGNLPEFRAAIASAMTRRPLRIDLPRTAPPVPPEAEVVRYAELRRREVANLRAALARSGGKVSGPGGAAELLGIKATTLTSKIKAMGIRE